MRIAVFTNAYKPIASGVVNSIDLLKNALVRRGHEVYIFAPRFNDYCDEEDNVYRYISVDLTNKVKFPIAIPFSIKISNVLKKFNPDVIHTHHPFVLGRAAYNYARKLDIPLVFTFHTQYEMYSHYIPLPENIVKYSCRVAVRNFAEKADCVTTPADSIARLLRTYGIQNRIEVIPNAIDLEPYQNVPDEKVRKVKGTYGLEDRKVVLFVGRIAPEKNLVFLLDAFKKVVGQIKEAVLLIVGDGPQLPELKDYVNSHELEKNVVFAGRVEYCEIPAFYRASDIFAIASTTEVKPLVILEALAAGLPVVAVNAPGAMDTITHGFDGMLTDLDVDAFSRGIVQVMSDDILHQKLKNGALQTAGCYSIDRISEKVIALYNDVVRKKEARVQNDQYFKIKFQERKRK